MGEIAWAASLAAAKQQAAEQDKLLLTYIFAPS
jgi:hypothetical protein